MAAAATPMEIDEFLNGALVSWLESCLPRSEIFTGYTSLLDGQTIHSVWLQIDPEPQNNPIEIQELSGTPLCVARAKNFEIIVRNLKTLFEEELGQTLLVLPDAYTLGYQPETKHGLEQMKILLTLLLGAAVQCPNKELFIARIKELDLETQHEIVELIKQVTDNQSLVLTVEAVETLTPTALYHQLLRLTKERDTIYVKWINSLCTEPEVHLQCNVERNTSLPLSPASGVSSSTPSSATNSESNHMAVELADLKSKLRKIRQELEEKTESQLELREELEHKTVQYEKLRLQSQQWYAEAKRATAYRDENDVLKERAERADRLEIEIQKFREKLTDAEFYKTRVEELRGDNRVLVETKDMLEDQLLHARKRSEQVMHLESEIIKYKQKLNDMALERDSDRAKLDELIEENIQLQLVAKNLNMTQDLDKRLSDSEEGGDEHNSGDNSLSEQLKTNEQTETYKLQLEVRRLTAALDKLKESSFHESTNKILELEKDKKRLSLKVDQLQENIQRMSQQNIELENVFKNALEENKKLQDTLDQRQKSYDRQSLERDSERSKLIELEKYVETLTKEKQRIQTLNESIQRRADDLERLNDTRSKELEQCSEKMQQLERTKKELYDNDAKLTALERENCSLTKEIAKLKQCLEVKSVQLDESTIQLDASTSEVEHLTQQLAEVEQLQLKVAELEQQNHDLQSQHDIDTETIETLRNDLVSGTLATNKVRHNFEKLGIIDAENDANGGSVELNVATVVEKLVRNPETFKTVREIMLNVQRERGEEQDEPNCELAKSDMCVLCHRKEIFTVEKNIELATSVVDSAVSSSGVLCDGQELNFEHKIIRNSPPRDLNTQLHALNAALQTSNDQLQTDNARLQVDVATLSSQISSLNTQHVALQLANSQLAAEKDLQLKQLEAIQQAHKKTLHDQATMQCLHDQLSADYDSVVKCREELKAINRDLRNESREQRERITTLEAELEELRKQNATMKTCAEDLAILRTEHSKLTDDFRNLFATNDRFKNEYKNIQEQYKIIRMENNKLKLQNTELSGELNSKGDEYRLLEIEYHNAQQRCESLMQMNADLDMDRKTLMDNVSKLLSQYHELLSHSLEDKQHFHEEEKSYAERLHNLSRQKEKLEEKIMEQYKNIDNTASAKKKHTSGGLLRRMKKASTELMNKVPSRNRRSYVDDTRSPQSQSQFMVGSESGGNDSDNSNEDHNSMLSDTHIIQRNIPLRQSLQRDVLDISLMRGGVMRSSLQTQQQQQQQSHHTKRLDLNNSRRNSVHGLEAPDVTGSSLTLGTAGSRRTVYLIDENQKLPDTNSTTTTTPTAATIATTATPTTGTIVPPVIAASQGAAVGTILLQTSQTNAAEPQTPIPTPPASVSGGSATGGSTNNTNNNNGSNGGSNSKTDSPATFLMYNRIHTTIGGNSLAPSLDNANNSGATTGAATTQDDKLLRKRGEDKSNSVWYEYGCV